MDLSIKKLNHIESEGNKEEIEHIVNIAKRHRRSIVPMDEVSIITNFLKYDADDLDNSIFLNPESVVCPSLLKEYKTDIKIKLNPNENVGKTNIYDILKLRASRRDYSYENITQETLSNILFFSYGQRDAIRAYNNDNFPLRYAPSAGGLQSNDLYVVINKVEGIEKGLYYYNFKNNSLILVEAGYMKNRLLECCVGQEFITDASVIIILAANLKRVKWKYSKKAYRFVHVDTGILSENIHLLATANKLRSCMIAGFNDDKINEFLMLDGENEFVSLLISIGTSPWSLERGENHNEQ